MSKGKYKRKRERARERAKQKSEQPQPQIASVASPQAQTHAESAKLQTTTMQKSAMKPSKIQEHISVSNLLLVFFTGILAVVAVFQGFITNNQLDIMRNDERAWLEFRLRSTENGKPATTPYTVNRPLDVGVEVFNSGKTLAKKVRIDAFIENPDASRRVNLSFVDELARHPHMAITTGTVFPNSDIKDLVTKFRPDGSADLITQADIDGMINGSKYFAIYGIITYTDVFGDQHWTKFCKWYANVERDYPVAKCTEFNDVDRENPSLIHRVMAALGLGHHTET